jgi:hypothetical protein
MVDLIMTFGVPIGVIIWIAIGVIKLVTEHGPAVVSRYQDRKTDQAEHTQDIERQRLRHQELMELTEAGSRTYTEEQLTQHLSEIYTEFGTVNAFIRETVSATLQRIETKVDQILLDVRDIAPMKERLAEIRMYARSLHKQLEVLDEKTMEMSPTDQPEVHPGATAPGDLETA